MITTIKFNLPEENDELQDALHASDYKYIIDELDMFLRQNIKYAPDTQSEEVTDTYQKIRDQLYNLKEQIRD